MKNNKVIYGIISAIVLIITDLIVFLLVKDYNATRWVNIAFLNFSVICALIFSFISGEKDDIYMNYARIPIVYSYAIIDFIASAIFITINLSSIIVTIIVQVILLGIFIVAMLTNKMSNNTAKENKQNDKNKYDEIKEMTNKLEIILNSIEDRELYKKVEKAYDDIKNSKLNINEDTSVIDAKIMKEINIIELNLKNHTNIDEQISNIHNLVLERNMKN